MKGLCSHALPDLVFGQSQAKIYELDSNWSYLMIHDHYVVRFYI